jgi:hypothetical protein
MSIVIRTSYQTAANYVSDVGKPVYRQAGILPPLRGSRPTSYNMKRFEKTVELQAPYCQPPPSSKP